MPNSNPSRNAKYLHNAPFYQAFSRKTLPLDSTKTLRLYPDMFPLVRQLRAVTDHAISGTARLASAELITFPNNEVSFPEVKDRIEKTIDFVKSFKPAQIDGTEDKEIVVKFSSGERKFKGQAFLLNFCLPNFYFHATTAYDILRHCGIELGKRDFMGTPVTL